MANLSNVTRINPSDYEEELRPTVTKLADNLNYFMQDVVDAFDKNINFDNTNMELVDINVVVSNNLIPTVTTLINSATGRIVVGIQVIRAINNTNSLAFLNGAPFISFTEQNNGYKITHITGLRPGENYTLKLLLITN